MKKIFSLFAAVLFAGSMMATDPVEMSGTFDGKAGKYTTGWTTTGTGVSRNDCVIVGVGENITSPSIDFSLYDSVSVSIKARRYGTLSGSKAQIAVVVGSDTLGVIEASSTTATNVAGSFVASTSSLSSTSSIVFTCKNATSAGSTHGAGINSITLTLYPHESAPAEGWDGTVTTSKDEDVITAVSQLDNLVLTFPGAQSIAIMDEEDCQYLSLQNEDGSEMYGIWAPTMGSTYTIEGNTITLSGFMSMAGVTGPVPAGTTALYIEDYGTLLIDDEEASLPTIELAANFAAPVVQDYTVTVTLVDYDETCDLFGAGWYDADDTPYEIVEGVNTVPAGTVIYGSAYCTDGGTVTITVNDVPAQVDMAQWSSGEITANTVIVITFSHTPTAVENTEAAKVVKTIENGQVVIIREGVRYNAVGAKL